jgi:NAD(P)-dependent dehydrogenase (short-subunit alcohol dehydrogenase family)
MLHIAITGANRGIGLELVRQLSARGDAVFAAARDVSSAAELNELCRAHPDRLRLFDCDVTSDASVAAFAAAVPAPVDVVINNAGVMGKMQSLEALDLDDVAHTFDINVRGPIRVTRAFLPHLRRASVRKLVHLSSKMGSIDDNRSGGAYGYRISKAALNMASRSMAQDLRREGIISVVLHPGWVQTRMGGASAPVPVAESVGGMISLIDRLTLDDSGEFFSFRGERVPW